jgi:hypothetical protein
MQHLLKPVVAKQLGPVATAPATAGAGAGGGETTGAGGGATAGAGARRDHLDGDMITEAVPEHDAITSMQCLHQHCMITDAVPEHDAITSMQCLHQYCQFQCLQQHWREWQT